MNNVKSVKFQCEWENSSRWSLGEDREEVGGVYRGEGEVTEADGSTSNFLLHNNEKESFA